MSKIYTFTVSFSTDELAIINTALESYLEEQPDREDIADLISKLEKAPADNL